uniref:SCP domain-containing protein n=1 Tax=Ciona savignyi TaxID=51511 RepID=H2YDR5_CIOSA
MARLEWWCLVVYAGVVLDCASGNLVDVKKFRSRRSLAGRLAQNGDITLTPAEIKNFVDEHNKYRRMDPASNMRLMSWDDATADVAKAYVNRCKWEHSPSATRKTSQFNILGENLAMAFGNYPITRDFITTTTFNWWNEIHDYTYSTQICKPGRQCGHYTQVAWADSYKVGCAAAYCDHQTFRHAIYVVCNYGSAGNYRGVHPFKQGQSCTDCTDSTDTCVDGLCANANRGDVITTSPSTLAPPTTPPIMPPITSQSTPPITQPTTQLTTSSTTQSTPPNNTTNNATIDATNYVINNHGYCDNITDANNHVILLDHYCTIHMVAIYHNRSPVDPHTVLLNHHHHYCKPNYNNIVYSFYDKRAFLVLSSQQRSTLEHTRSFKFTQRVDLVKPAHLVGATKSKPAKLRCNTQLAYPANPAEPGKWSSAREWSASVEWIQGLITLQNL